MTALPDPGRSRAVLIGASTYRHLADLPAVRNNLSGFRDVLIAPALGGLPADNCTIVAEPARPVDVYRALRQQAAAAEDTLLVYFAGHGRTGSRNELWLCLPDTDPDELPYSAWAYDELRRVVADSPATKKVVILDCCFSGRALADQAGDEERILGQVGIEGSYLLTATAANAVALAPPGERYTAFTGALLGLLTTGIPGGPELLTFDRIYPRLRGALTSRQLPRPRQQGSDTITHLALTRNLAYTKRRRTQRLSEAEARRVQERAAAKAQERALRARAAKLTKELERLKDQARHSQSLDAPEQQELRDAIDETRRKLEETTAAQSRAMAVGVERDRVATFGRLEDGLLQAGGWYRWGPYVSERQWGTVREDYSADGNAWDYLPHDHARSRAYRWGEDGLAGFCDVEQRLCLALALWNGRDPILKERAFGLTGAQGNHGQDVKEYWWYLDAIPSHAWNRWRYHYPQTAFPYQNLIEVNGSRNRYQPEYELVDTGAFDENRYWIVEVHYAKADPDDLLMKISVTNAGPDADTLHVLPTAWFRNTWSWEIDTPKLAMSASGDMSVGIDHPFCGRLELVADPGQDGAAPTVLFCENETNTRRLFGTEPITPYPKDGINDHVVGGAPTVNPQRTGTKCAFWYKVTVQPGATVELRLRLRPTTSGRPTDAFGAGFDRVMAQRLAEADEFYAELTPAAATADEAMVMRQALSGMLWSKQLYYYNVTRWLDGDPTQAPVPSQRRTGRNSRWRHFDSFDIMSVPDKWEYPWFAAWELGFHCIALAHLDPGFAKYQLILLCREWFQHPNGALPAYEWDFSDVNPPVQAWAALEVFAIDGSRDLDFLSRVFDQLLVNYTWWNNRQDAEGNYLFEGGFLGLDNIGSVDRSHLQVGGVLEQSDATGWMGAYALTMFTIAAVLVESGQRQARGQELKFLEHFAAISAAIDSHGLGDDADGLYYDRLKTPGGETVPVKVRSMASIIPALAAAVIAEDDLRWALTANKRFADFLGRHHLRMRGEPGQQRLLLSLCEPDRQQRLLAKMFDESEFLSPFGLRTLSAYHRDHPYTLEYDGVTAIIDYEPAESTTPAFGGNSNSRGPIWFPLNYLMITVLERYHRFYGDDFTIEYPTGSGQHLPLDQVAAALADRLISIFTRGPDGRRPCFGGTELLQTDPAWKDNLVFSEYFHGENAAGLGASHQTGWTGLVADIIIRRHGEGPAMGNVIHRGLGMQTQR